MEAANDIEVARLLDRLCVYFDGEIERQEFVLQVCQEQGNAARTMDPEALELQTQALARALTECALAEPARVEIVRGLTDRLAPKSRDWTLTELISQVPDPWSGRLRGHQARLSALVSAARDVISANAAMIRHSLRVVGDSVDRVLGPATAEAYTDSGDAPNVPRRAPAVLNARG